MAETTAPLPRILIVDDEPLIIRMLNEVLRSRYLLQVAVTGREALSLALADPPELILLDVGLPDLDGYEVCRRLRDHDRTNDIPVIFLTNHDSRKEVIRGFEAGGTDYVYKPFGVMELMARIDTHLRQHRQKVGLVDTLEQERRLCGERSDQIRTNLDLVGTVLGLHAGLAKSGEAAELLRSVQERVRIIDQILGILRTPPSSGSDTPPLLGAIASRLLNLSGREWIRLQIGSGSDDLSVDTASPCGLIMYELFATVPRPCLPEECPVTVTVGLGSEEGDLVLTVGVDGTGLAESYDPARDAPLGMAMVRALVGQLNGELTVGGTGGVTFVIRLPLPAR